VKFIEPKPIVCGGENCLVLNVIHNNNVMDSQAQSSSYP